MAKEKALTINKERLRAIMDDFEALGISDPEVVARAYLREEMAVDVAGTAAARHKLAQLKPTTDRISKALETFSADIPSISALPGVTPELEPTEVTPSLVQPPRLRGLSDSEITAIMSEETTARAKEYAELTPEERRQLFLKDWDDRIDFYLRQHELAAPLSSRTYDAAVKGRKNQATFVSLVLMWLGGGAISDQMAKGLMARAVNPRVAQVISRGATYGTIWAEKELGEMALEKEPKAFTEIAKRVPYELAENIAVFTAIAAAGEVLRDPVVGGLRRLRLEYHLRGASPAAKENAREFLKSYMAIERNLMNARATPEQARRVIFAGSEAGTNPILPGVMPQDVKNLTAYEQLLWQQKHYGASTEAMKIEAKKIFAESHPQLQRALRIIDKRMSSGKLSAKAGEWLKDYTRGFYLGTEYTKSAALPKILPTWRAGALAEQAFPGTQQVYETPFVRGLSGAIARVPITPEYMVQQTISAAEAQTFYSTTPSLDAFKNVILNLQAGAPGSLETAKKVLTNTIAETLPSYAQVVSMFAALKAGLISKKPANKLAMKMGGISEDALKNIYLGGVIRKEVDKYPIEKWRMKDTVSLANLGHQIAKDLNIEEKIRWIFHTKLLTGKKTQTRGYIKTTPPKTEEAPAGMSMIDTSNYVWENGRYPEGTTFEIHINAPRHEMISLKKHLAGFKGDKLAEALVAGKDLHFELISTITHELAHISAPLIFREKIGKWGYKRLIHHKKFKETAAEYKEEATKLITKHEVPPPQQTAKARELIRKAAAAKEVAKPTIRFPKDGSWIEESGKEIASKAHAADITADFRKKFPEVSDMGIVRKYQEETGRIRVNTTSGKIIFIDIKKKPTPAQLRTLRKIVKDFEPVEFVYDISSKNVPLFKSSGAATTWIEFLREYKTIYPTKEATKPTKEEALYKKARNFLLRKIHAAESRMDFDKTNRPPYIEEITKGRTGELAKATNIEMQEYYKKHLAKKPVVPEIKLKPAQRKTIELQIQAFQKSLKLTKQDIIDEHMRLAGTADTKDMTDSELTAIHRSFERTWNRRIDKLTRRIPPIKPILLTRGEKALSDALIKQVDATTAKRPFEFPDDPLEAVSLEWMDVPDSVRAARIPNKFAKHISGGRTIDPKKLTTKELEVYDDYMHIVKRQWLKAEYGWNVTHPNYMFMAPYKNITPVRRGLGDDIIQPVRDAEARKRQFMLRMYKKIDKVFEAFDDLPYSDRELAGGVCERITKIAEGRAVKPEATKAEKEAAKAMRQLFNVGHKLGTTAGLELKYLQQYAPILPKAGTKWEKQLRKIEMDRINRALTKVDVPLIYDADFFALHARIAKRVPDSAREMNARVILRRWFEGLSRMMFIRPAIRDIAPLFQQMLKPAQQDVAERWVNEMYFQSSKESRNLNELGDSIRVKLGLEEYIPKDIIPLVMAELQQMFYRSAIGFAPIYKIAQWTQGNFLGFAEEGIKETLVARRLAGQKEWIDLCNQTAIMKLRQRDFFHYLRIRNPKVWRMIPDKLKRIKNKTERLKAWEEWIDKWAWKIYLDGDLTNMRQHMVLGARKAVRQGLITQQDLGQMLKHPHAKPTKKVAAILKLMQTKAVKVNWEYGIGMAPTYRRPIAGMNLQYTSWINEGFRWLFDIGTGSTLAGRRYPEGQRRASRLLLLALMLFASQEVTGVRLKKHILAMNPPSGLAPLPSLMLLPIIALVSKAMGNEFGYAQTWWKAKRAMSPTHAIPGWATIANTTKVAKEEDSKKAALKALQVLVPFEAGERFRVTKWVGRKLGLIEPPPEKIKKVPRVRKAKKAR